MKIPVEHRLPGQKKTKPPQKKHTERKQKTTPHLSTWEILGMEKKKTNDGNV